MNLMKSNIVIGLLLCLVSFDGFSQTLYVESSFSSAFFKDYTSESSSSLENSYSKPVELGLGLGVLFEASKNGRLKLDLGINFNKYKIHTSIRNGNTKIPSHYNLSYVSMRLGPYYSILNRQKIKIQIHSHGSFDYLVFGSNQYKDVFVDLTNQRDFNRLMLNYHFGAAIEFLIKDGNYLYLSYDSKQSLKNTIEDGESYSISVNSIMLGFRFNLNKT
tara:strand:- start:1155 stop:1808 length:654 start_codon:yes stop_codon:yes gene_type:complete